jgi:hypothetical protein
MRLLLLAAAVGLLAGCGYIASPLAPLINIPARVSDLAAVERGDKLILQFTVPQLTTEGVALQPPIKLDLRVGVGPNPWDEERWAAEARQIPATAASASGKPPAPGGLAHYEVPDAEWVGKDVVAAARVIGANGKVSGWSNVVNVPVIAPPERPQNISPQMTAAGLHLTWQAHGEHFRVLRAAGNSEHYDVVATVTQPEWTDPNAQIGTAYRYMVQTFVPQPNNREAQSDPSEPYAVTPQAVPPAAPAGLRVVPAPNSIELSWDGSPEPDVTGYRIYRGAPDGPLEKIGETSAIPSYSDRSARHGNNYRYAVTAVNPAGQESPQSQAVAVGYP